MPKGVYRRTPEMQIGKYIKTPEHRAKLSQAQKGKLVGDTNGHWKGDNVSYDGLHRWIIKRLGKPDTCKRCGESGLSGRYINWANVSGKYSRDLNDWIRLCRKCHHQYDDISTKGWKTKKETKECVVLT